MRRFERFSLSSPVLFTLVFAAAWLAAPDAQAQVCAGDIQIATQAEVDAFDCVEVLGNLIISGPQITDLSPLSGLASVGGNLLISWNSTLINLSGLNGLTSIGGSLRVASNYSLRNILGLDNLVSIGDYLSVTYNYLLSDLTGLESLETVSGGIWIYENHVLTSVDGLEALTSVGGNLGFYRNYELADLSGLANLTSIGGHLRIDTSELPNLSGLESLTSIGALLWVTRNDSLTNVDALANLTSVGGNLRVHDNPVLSECTVGLGDLLAEGGVGGASFISDNAPGCNSVWEAIGGNVDAEDEATPLVTGLGAPYPNPTAGSATLTFTLAEPGEVALTVYDALGRRVRTLAEEPHAPGVYEASVGAGLPAGVYVVRFKAGGQVFTERVTIIR